MIDYLGTKSQSLFKPFKTNLERTKASCQFQYKISKQRKPATMGEFLTFLEFNKHIFPF